MSLQINDQTSKTGANELGKVPPKGKGPVKGKVPPKGKGTIFLGSSAREAGVIVRASVEAFGAVGGTDLTVTVHWPAGNVGAVNQDNGDTDEDSQPSGVNANVDGPASSE